MPAFTSPAVDTLTEVNIDDLIDAIGSPRFCGAGLRRLLRPTARRFALQAHEFDTRVGAQGLVAGSSWLLHQMTAGVRTAGLAHVPAQGPVMILSNHPGMTDTVALFSSLAVRPDLRVIALDRPFLRALPHVARQLIFLSDDASGYTAAIRAGVRHLKDGGALLTFPAGDIEPDPATFGARRALGSLEQWSPGYALFARLAPQTRFVPALVSHVISPAAQRHPLTRLRRSPRNREKLATALQVARPRYHDQTAQVRFDAPIEAAGADAASAQALCAAVTARMRELILAHGAA